MTNNPTLIFSSTNIAEIRNGQIRHLTQRTIIHGDTPKDFQLFIVQVTIPIGNNKQLSGNFPIINAKTPQEAFSLYNNTVTLAVETLKDQAAKQANQILTAKQLHKRNGRPHIIQ